MDELLSHIPHLLTARYPLLWLVSAEEERVERGLERLAAQNKLQLHRWRATTGLVAQGGLPVPDTRDAYAALQAVETFDGPALFLFEDPGKALKDELVVRRIRDLERELGTRRQGLLVLSHRLDIPADVLKPTP